MNPIKPGGGRLVGNDDATAAVVDDVDVEFDDVVATVDDDEVICFATRD